MVEIVRARDIPSVYLSAVPPLRLRMDDVPQSRALRESLFSSWSEGGARAQTPGDAPAMVVKSQWRMKASGTIATLPTMSFQRRYCFTPSGNAETGTTAMEFHLRPRVGARPGAPLIRRSGRERLEQVERQHRQYE